MMYVEYTFGLIEPKTQRAIKFLVCGANFQKLKNDKLLAHFGFLLEKFYNLTKIREICMFYYLMSNL